MWEGTAHDPAQPLPSLLMSHHRRHGFMPQLQPWPLIPTEARGWESTENGLENAVAETWKGMGKLGTSRAAEDGVARMALTTDLRSTAYNNNTREIAGVYEEVGKPQ